MNIEARLQRLEKQNRKLRLAIVCLAIPVIGIPLLAFQGKEDMVIQDPNTGWSLKIGTEGGKRGGFGLFLRDRAGVARGRVAIVDGEARIGVSSAKGDHGAALVAESDKASALGVWKGDQWRHRTQIDHGRPNTVVYDGAGKVRLRYGMLKGDSYLTLVDQDGETDRAWMVLESTGRASVAVRGGQRAEVAMSAREGRPIGLSVRDTKGKMRALVSASKDEAHIYAYGKSEIARAGLSASTQGDTAIEVIDERDQKRVHIGAAREGHVKLSLTDAQGNKKFEK